VTGGESWRAVPGYEGLYEVSDHGRVRSLDRVVITANGKRLPVRGRVLRPSQRPNAGRGTYRNAILSQDGQTRNFKVHVLVMSAFVGPRPPGMVVCHDNGDGTDNRLANLRYDTPAANMADARRHGTNHNLRKTHCPHGHAYDEANTRVTRSGRQCRICLRAADHSYRRRKMLGSAGV
jgi:hypothetical protein